MEQVKTENSYRPEFRWSYKKLTFPQMEKENKYVLWGLGFGVCFFFIFARESSTQVFLLWCQIRKSEASCGATGGWADERTPTASFSFLCLCFTDIFRLWHIVMAYIQHLSGFRLYLDLENSISIYWNALPWSLSSVYRLFASQPFSLHSMFLVIWQLPMAPDLIDYILLFYTFIVSHENSLLPCSCLICNLQTGLRSLKKTKKSPKAHHKTRTSCSAAVASSARGKRVVGPGRRQAAACASGRRGAGMRSPPELWRRGAAWRLFVRAAGAREGEGTRHSHSACVSGRTARSRATLSSLHCRALLNKCRWMLSCHSGSHFMTDVVSFLFLHPSVVPLASPPPVRVWRPAPPGVVTDPLSL